MDLKELKERNYDVSGLDSAQLNALKDTLPLICSADYENALYNADVKISYPDPFGWFVFEIEPSVHSDDGSNVKDEFDDMAKSLEHAIEDAFTQEGDVLGVVEDGRYIPLPLYFEYSTGNICPISDVFKELTADLEDSYECEYETEDYYFDTSYGNYLPDSTTHTTTAYVDWNVDLEEAFETFKKRMSELPLDTLTEQARAKITLDLISDYRTALEPVKPIKPVSKAKENKGEGKE